jgi:hypothetical protein
VIMHTDSVTLAHHFEKSSAGRSRPVCVATLTGAAVSLGRLAATQCATEFRTVTGRFLVTQWHAIASHSHISREGG